MTSEPIGSATYDSPLAIAAMTIIGLAGSTIAIIIPSLMDAFVRFKGLDPASAASIVSGEMLGMTISTALAALVLSRFDRRRLAIAALTVCALANFGSIASSNDVSVLYALRFAAGFGEGVLIALVAAALGGTRVPDRNFAIFVACNMLMSAILFRVVPAVVEAVGFKGVFLVLLGLLFAATLALPWFPNKAPGAAVHATAQSAKPAFWTAPVVAALLGVLVFFTASGTVWPLMPYFAGLANVPDTTVAGLMSNATLAGLGAALLGSVIGARWGRRLPLTVGAALLVASMAAIVWAGPTLFAAACALFMGAYMFSTPYYYATLAAADSTGRAVAFSMSVQFLGLTIGPLLGPPLNAYAQGYGAIFMGSVLTGVALLLVTNAGKGVTRALREAR